jgi:hypothetical protein
MAGVRGTHLFEMVMFTQTLPHFSKPFLQTHKPSMQLALAGQAMSHAPHAAGLFFKFLQTPSHFV